MADNSFFKESKDQSKIKANIVGKYFYAWAKIIMPRARSNKVAYIDLYCGPGKYEDGTHSTPLLILERAIQFPDMSDKLVSLFNDKDPEHVRLLEEAVTELPGIEKLHYKPKFLKGAVEEGMTKMFQEMTLIPSLVFLDPFGYKGLTVDLISALFKDWGCDAIFFFNYNRINMGIDNPAMQDNINKLFGEERVKILKEALNGIKKSEEREEIILQQLEYAIQVKGGKYFLPFRFRKGKKTSHHIIFVSKNILGYSIMKQIMAKECISDSDGIPSFEYNCEPPSPPSDNGQISMFDVMPSNSLEKLGRTLMIEFKSRTITVKDIIEGHHVGKQYIEKNYKDALRKLEKQGEISCEPPADKRRMMNGVRTISDKVNVTFK